MRGRYKCPAIVCAGKNYIARLISDQQCSGNPGLRKCYVNNTDRVREMVYNPDFGIGARSNRNRLKPTGTIGPGEYKNMSGQIGWTVRGSDE